LGSPRSARDRGTPQRGIAGIVGPYRYQNFGDDLIGLILARQLSRIGFEEVWMHDIAPANAGMVGAIVRPRSDVIWRPKLVVIGGGHILGDGSYLPGVYYQRLAFFAALTRWLIRRRTEICGVGAGPLALWRARLYAGFTCRLVKRVGVRDAESSRFVMGSLKCAEAKVAEGADLALLWPKLLPTRIHEPEDRFAVGVQMDLPRSIETKNLKVSHSALRPLGDRVMYLSNGRRATRARSIFQLPGPESNYRSMPEFLQELTRCRILITSHLHLAIAAYAARIPSFTLAINSKTRRFYDQIGHPDRCLELSSSDSTEANRALMELVRRATYDCGWSAHDERRLAELQQNAGRLLEGLGR
jgi:polysaccharide pyruvyl transferase WcaK-like protein